MQLSCLALCGLLWACRAHSGAQRREKPGRLTQASRTSCNLADLRDHGIGDGRVQAEERRVHQQRMCGSNRTRIEQLPPRANNEKRAVQILSEAEHRSNLV